MFGDKNFISRDAVNSAAYEQLPWYDVIRCRAEEIRRAGLRGETAGSAGPYIALSRLAGAGGGEIAERLGETLGWPIMGKQLLERIARRHHIDPSLLELLDESPTNLLYEALGHLLNSELISQNAYLSYLRKTVRAAAAEGPAIFVGRGAQYFLPLARTLNVRVIADEADRIERVRRRSQLSRAVARKLVHERDKSRAAFIERYFHRDLNDAAGYDLVVNSSRLGVDGCVDAIFAALRARYIIPAEPRRRPLAASAP